MLVRAVDDKPSDTLVVVPGEGSWTGSSTLPHLHQSSRSDVVLTNAASVDAATLVALILVSAAALIVVALHVVRTDVDPLTDGVSAFALTSFGYLYRAQVVAIGVAATLLTVALVAGNLASGIGVAALALFGGSRILIARYPTDPRGTTRFSRAGRPTSCWPRSPS